MAETGGLPADGASGGTGSLAARSPMSLCDRVCQRQKDCDMKEDHQTCLAACTNVNASVVPKLRADVIDLVDTCLVSADCRTVLQGKTLAGCLTVAAATISPTAAGSAMCDAYFNRADQCLGTVGKSECLTSAKLFSDKFIGQAMSCLSKDCSLLNPCLQATLNAATGNAGIGAGLPAVKLCQGTATRCSYLSSSGGFGADRCEKQSGCKGTAGCSGNLACYYPNSQSECTAIGCTWTTTPNNFDRCSGTPTKTCSSLSTSQSCNAAFPCSWRIDCAGSVVTCEKIHATSCANQAGCTLN